ncbi:MAG: two-component regulator propeller domain-containing protein [Niabella sp.]
MKELLVIYFLCCFPVVGSGQSFYFRHYGVEDGLSNNSVINIVQDRLGFMWFGTSDGLNKFDGNNFKIYRNTGEAGSIGSNSIYSLLKDSRGILWIGTEKGLYYYNYDSDSFSKLNIAAPGSVRSICDDGKGGIFFTIKNQLFHFTGLGRSLIKKTFGSVKELTTIYRSNIGNSIWLGTSDSRLLYFSADSVAAFKLSGSHLNSIETIAGYDAGYLMIGTSAEGLMKFDINNAKAYPLINKENTGEDIFVRGILKQSDSTWFISTERGLFLYNQYTSRFKRFIKDIANPYSLSDNALYGMYKDNEGGVWIGSYFGGINYLSYNNNQFEKYFPTPLANSLAGNAIREITKDRYGNLWIGSEDGGLTKYDASKKLFIKYTPNPVNRMSSSNIHGLLALENQLLIGTFEHGIDVMDIASGKVVKNYPAGSGPYQLKSNFINKIFRTSDNILLICTAQGIYRFDIQKGLFYLIKELPVNTFYSAITEDHNGTVWIGTHNRGLFYLTKSGAGLFTANTNNGHKLSDTRILYLMEDTGKYLWVCTTDGLHQLNLKDSSRIYYNKVKGLPSDIVYSIVQDNFNNYWIPTSQGLARLDHKSRQIKIFRRYNGILNNQFNYQSVYKETNGDIYIGSIKGLIRFNPSAFHSKAYIPPLYITALQQPGINLQPDSTDRSRISLLNTRHLELPYNQASFNIEFVALNFTNPVNITYAYKINNSGWYQLGNMRKIAFTNLSPGKYDITVRSTNGAGLWMPNEKNITIRILPPIWKSKTAYLLYSIAVIVLITLLYKYFSNRQKEKQRYKMDLFVLNKEKELYQAKMDFFTNITHEIKTPLTLIKVPLETISKNAGEIPQFQKHLQIMKSNADRLFELTNQLLDFRKTETDHYQLYFSQTDISEIITDTWSRFTPAMEQRKIKYSLSVAAQPVIIWGDKDALTKIISNLMDNAIKYCDTEVSLQMKKPELQQTIQITVMNDGPAIPPEFRDKIFEPFIRLHIKNVAGSGIGLSLARSFTELHKGTLEYFAINNFNIFELTLPYAAAPIKAKN